MLFIFSRIDIFIFISTFLHLRFGQPYDVD